MTETSDKKNEHLNLALTHDFLNQFGGAERALDFLARIFPNAPIYTSIYFPESTYEIFKSKEIHKSFMQKIPGVNRHFKKLLALYPIAFRSFDLSVYDLIIASSSSFASFVKKSKKALLVCYCYTPPRFLWLTDKYLEGEKISKAAILILKPLIRLLRTLDLKNSRNVDHYVAISKNIKDRIKKIYGRDSVVIYPPIEVCKYTYREKKEDFYLMVSRLKGYKKVDIAVAAFNNLGKKLIVVGTGEDYPSLKKMAKPNIEFLGRVSEERLYELYSKAKALIFTGEEDFGLAPLEAQASGTPVIAYGFGGSKETVVEGETGYLFYKQDSKHLIDTIKKFEYNPINSKNCYENAKRFDFDNFQKEIRDYINNILEK